MSAHVSFDPASNIFYVRYSGEHCVGDVNAVLDYIEASGRYAATQMYFVDMAATTSSALTRPQLVHLKHRLAAISNSRTLPAGSPLFIGYHCPTHTARQVGSTLTGSWNLDPNFISMCSDRLGDCAVFLNSTEEIIKRGLNLPMEKLT